MYMTSKIENIEEVGSHEFSRNQKIVTDGFKLWAAN